MYLQLDHHILIPKGKVLGIFDLDHSSWEKTSRDFLAQAEKEGRVFGDSTDLPRSFVLVGEDFGNTTVYLSSRTSYSLRKRQEDPGIYKEETAWKRKS